MPYQPTTWTNGAGAPINDDNLNRLESGVDQAVAHAEGSHAPTNADNTAENETSHEHVVVDEAYVHTDSNYTVAEKDKLAAIGEDAEANSVEIDEVNVFQAAQRTNRVYVDFTSSIELDMDLSNKFEVVVTGNTKIENPLNITRDQGGIIYVVQDAVGGRSVTWGTLWKFNDTHTPSVAPNAINMYAYEVYDLSHLAIIYVGVL